MDLLMITIIKKIPKRCIAQLSEHEKATFKDSIHLYPKNDDVDAYNQKCLSKLQSPVALILAKGVPYSEHTTNADEITGLMSQLCLAEGARAMLRRNLHVPAGLVNGARGTIRHIVYHNSTPPDHPDYILVEFDNYMGPYFNDRCFAIVPISHHWMNKGTSWTRTQFALTLSFASTIHKSQGLTLDVGVIDIGPKELFAGCTYTAISRFPAIDRFMLLMPYAADRWNITHMVQHQTKMTALAKLRTTIEQQQL